MSKIRGLFILGLLIVLAILWGSIANVSAQQLEPRPTPTYEPDSPTSPSLQGARGSIQGLVYEDVDGDGRCVETGVAGEEAVMGVAIQFVSSDEETVITLQSGPDGRFGLFAAGYSYWNVSARPGADWVVTSDASQTVPIYEDSLNATGINFCVQEAGAAKVLLPESGGSGITRLLVLVLFAGLSLFGFGTGLFFRQNEVK